MLGSLDSGRPPHPRTSGCVGFGHVKTLAIRNRLISKLYQHFRACPVLNTGVRGHPAACPCNALREPTGCSVYASPVLFALPRLRPRRKTRYGWVASLYPTGTLTLPASLSRRDNAMLEGAALFAAPLSKHLLGKAAFNCGLSPKYAAARLTRSVYDLLHLRQTRFHEFCAGIRQILPQILAKGLFCCLLELRCHHH